MNTVTKNIFARGKGNLTYTYNYDLHIFSIDSVFVKRSFRKQGVGTKLMNRAIEKAKEYHERDKDVCMALEVDRDFYEFKLTKWFKSFKFRKGTRFKKYRKMYRYL
jgi:predicted GNAT family acetyltransferase